MSIKLDVAVSDDDLGLPNGRRESFHQRMDRNWNELLQELRVAQTGAQVFTGFLLTIAFLQRFRDLTAFQVQIYLILVVTAVVTTALGLAPVNLHRALFRKGAKLTIVQTAHVIMRITLGGIAIMLSGTVLLIFDLVVGRNAALIMGGITLFSVIILAALPLLLHRHATVSDKNVMTQTHSIAPEV